ncbi:hypothetical protein ACFXNW_06600 [Nocardia sp. NPDC059180]|uniref:hypothetical protein n=1 Tax=Nocardia sp. NPDC059180 TaxID=3346761 RepID=UPI00368C67E9
MVAVGGARRDHRHVEPALQAAERARRGPTRCVQDILDPLLTSLRGVLSWHRKSLQLAEDFEREGRLCERTNSEPHQDQLIVISGDLM